MAYRYHIDPAVNCAFIRHFDDYSRGEGFEVFKEILDDPLYRRDMNILRELHQISFPKSLADPYAAGEIRRHLEGIDPLFGTCRIVWVVNSAADYAIAHRWTVSARLSGGIERNVFREMAKAKAWLGMPTDYRISFPDQGDVK